MNVGLPVVGIVGRPNVGKSTLFNRLVGRRDAVVAPEPGVTRDRKAAEAAWRGHPFVVVDTGGWSADGDTLDNKVSEQSERAMGDADVLLLVVDVTVGITEPDARIAAMLRRSGRPTLVVANMADSGARDDGRWEFNRLGLGEAWAVSALHGRNVGDVLDRVLELFDLDSDADSGSCPGRLDAVASAAERATPDRDESISDSEALVEGEAAVPAVAIVGRPNVGKSTLFNRLIGDERSVVHDRPGTTRDSIDTLVETEAGPVRFVDTAGMRRKARVDADTEYYANLRALRAIDACDVSLLVIDATEGVTAQDQRLAERIDAECVVRGYITGSGWVDYQRTGQICGIDIPSGMQEAEPFADTLFTPATKAETGHDENISFAQLSDLVGAELAGRLRDVSIAVYSRGRDYASERGIILADTKFEFGWVDGVLTLIDEVLTPDSSRFWDVAEYDVGLSPPSFDKQIVRNHLIATGWDREPPIPSLPAEIIERTAERYREAQALLAG